jgi:hypothetical protein
MHYVIRSSICGNKVLFYDFVPRCSNLLAIPAIISNNYPLFFAAETCFARNVTLKRWIIHHAEFVLSFTIDKIIEDNYVPMCKNEDYQVFFGYF